MPIPLAHPAAVLPLRRFCPRHLSFPALAIGSIAPDAAYAIDDVNKFSRTIVFFFGARTAGLQSVREAWDWDDFSHTWLGSLFFCVPVGLLMLSVFHQLRASVARTLPNPHRASLLPLCASRPSPLPVTAASLLVGAWLH